MQLAARGDDSAVVSHRAPAARPGGESVPVVVMAALTPSAGRDEGFDRYVRPEMGVLYRVALSVTRDHAEAEDLVQDTLLRAYRGLGGFDGTHPRAWLLTILRNTNSSRHRRRRPDLLDDPERMNDLAASTPADSGPEHDATVTLLDAQVERAFLALPAAQQAAIRLVDIGGLSYKEAAVVLGVPIGTVMSQLHRGRKRIKRSLTASGIGGRGL